MHAYKVMKLLLWIYAEQVCAVWINQCSVFMKQASVVCMNQSSISMEQVKYAVREYACRAIDVLARRTRLAFTDVHAAKEALPRIVDIMAEELGWSEQRKKVMEGSVYFLW